MRYPLSFQFTLLGAFLVFLFLPSNANSGPEGDATSHKRQDQIEAIESKLSKEKKKFQAFHYAEKDLLKELADLESEVSRKREAMEHLGGKIRSAAKEIENANERLHELETESGKLEAQMAERLVVLYKYARKGSFKMLAGAEDLNQFWRRARYLRAILQEDRRSILTLAEKQAAVRAEVSALQKEIDKKEEVRDQEEKRLAAVKRELNEKVIRLMKVHREKEFYETAVRELESAAKELRQAVRRIEKRPTYEAARAGRLADFRGRLPPPMEGEVVTRSKFATVAGLQGGKGILITAPSDSEVRAVFSGRVDYSGKLKGYGEVVIIGHGSRYFSISAHLSERSKEEGELVRGGEAIGWVRAEKESGRPWLYFEMREGEKNLDVLQWLKPPQQAER
jgi:septal ring factor EnvC (AmiA/AmiB activator)